MPLSEVSVCMASYNGSAHISEQLVSILGELAATDEVVVVDDGSTDDTVSIVRGFRDPRIKVFTSATNHGHVAAFERAISLASHPFILLADQDDIWVPGRRQLMLEGLARHDVVASNHREFDGGSTTVGRPAVARSVAQTPINVVSSLALGTSPYFGCAMGLSAKAKSLALPIPRFVEAHDHWIALVGARLGGVYVIKENTVLRRIHAGNLTPASRRSLAAIVLTRLRLVLSLVVLLTRPHLRKFHP